MEILVSTKDLDISHILERYKNEVLDDTLIEIISDEVDKEYATCLESLNEEEVAKHFECNFSSFHLLEVEPNLTGIQKLDIVKELIKLDLTTLEKIYNENRY